MVKYASHQPCPQLQKKIGCQALTRSEETGPVGEECFACEEERIKIERDEEMERRARRAEERVWEAAREVAREAAREAVREAAKEAAEEAAKEAAMEKGEGRDDGVRKEI